MEQPSKFRTLRDYVDSYPRAVTQAQIAKILGLTPDRLSGYLSGRRPNTDDALRISREFYIDLEGLLDPASKDDESGRGPEQPAAVAP